MKTSFETNVPLQARAAGYPVPLTPSQRLAWKQLASQGRLSERLCAGAVRILGPLDTDVLRASLGMIVQRHESLRTRIVLRNAVPGQQVDRAEGYGMDEVDLSDSSSTDAEPAAGRLAQESLDEKFDVCVGPLFKVRLITLSDSNHVLILLLDHLVSDGASHEILSREIWMAYSQLKHGSPVRLPHLPVQFADYAVWQELTWGDWCKQHEPYWRSRLAHPPGIQFPLPEAAQCSGEVITESMHFPFGRALSGRLRQLAEREHTHLSLVVMAVYVVAISRWCNQRDLLVHFVSDGRRRRAELEHMIGWLASPLYLRVQLATTDRFLDLLQYIGHEFAAALSHWDGDRLFDLFPALKVNLNFNWLPTSLAQGFPRAVEGRPRELTLQPFRVKWRPSLLFYAFFSETDAGIGMTVYFPRDSVAATAIGSFGRDVRLLAQHFERDPRALAH